ncbi:MAG: hypothetical protein RLZZ282_1655 [Verrucomicrobiota bacterium]|jgi:hypothetical protein
MDWILDHLDIVALIALAFGSWVKRRIDARRAEQDERASPYETSTDDDGPFEPETFWPQVTLPTLPPPLDWENSPPPIVARETPSLRVKSEPPPIKPGSAFFTAKTIEVNPLPVMGHRTQAVVSGKATTTGGAAATRTRVAASQTHIPSGQARQSGLHASLRHRKAVRHAMVMREILGPPLGLR